MNSYSSIEELGAALRKKELSAVELTRWYLARLERYGAQLGAVVTIVPQERAEDDARRADAMIARRETANRPLLGIPYGVKDLLATKGLATTWGAEPFRNQMLDTDAAVVRQLNAAGAVLCAKLSMVELAGGFGYNNADASFTGPGRNPWNTNFWSGGSSSGPGAAVAAALVPFAIGSETSGSIITPSAFCGITGLRPTYGAVSREGAMPCAWTLDKLGPMCRSAADCNIVFREILGGDAQSSFEVFPPGRPRWIAASAMRPQKFRIGIASSTFAGVQPEVRRNFLSSIETLKAMGHSVNEVAFPTTFPYGAVIGTIVDAECASAFEEIIRDGRAKQLRAAADRTGGFAKAATLAVDYLRAQRIRVKIRAALLKMFEQIDLFASPSRSTVAYPIGPNFDEAYKGVDGGPSVIAAFNLLGGPAISMPNGFGDDHLPTGIQLNGPPASEMTLMNVALQVQRATDFHTRTPPEFS